MPPTTSTTHIAPHLREPVFRAYEDILRQAVEAWPRETFFSLPPDIASATFVANFRNAVTSLKNYHWETTVDVAKLMSIETPRQFAITLDEDGKVWFRARRAVGRKPSGVTTSSREAERPHTTPPPSLVPWRDATQEEIHALCLLIDKQRLTGPFFISGVVPEDFTNECQTLYNVALVYDPTKDQTVIT